MSFEKKTFRHGAPGSQFACAPYSIYFSYLTILFILSCVKEQNRTVCKVFEQMSDLTYSQIWQDLAWQQQRKCSAEYLQDFAKFCRFNPQFLRHLQYINGRRLHTERNLLYFRTQDSIIFQLLFSPHRVSIKCSCKFLKKKNNE